MQQVVVAHAAPAADAVSTLAHTLATQLSEQLHDSGALVRWVGGHRKGWGWVGGWFTVQWSDRLAGGWFVRNDAHYTLLWVLAFPTLWGRA